MSTVREYIFRIQVELRDPSEDVTPGRASQMLTQLTSLLGNVNDEIRQADLAYAEVLLKQLDIEESANRAKIRAETSPEYLRKREARDTKELTLEMIRSLKYYLRSKEEEMRLAR